MVLITLAVVGIAVFDSIGTYLRERAIRNTVKRWMAARDEK
ncbi:MULTISPECIES: hypothetical protein [unclassified Microbacterium]|nr:MULTISPECIES: hypothetical protein [unclassified Microbacterium]